MAGKCLEKIGSVQIFLQEDGTIDGYDFKNRKYIPNPYGDSPPDVSKIKIKKKSDEEISKELLEISEYQSLAIPIRGLSKETIEYFGIKTGVSEVDGETPTIAAFPYYDEQGTLVRYKMRLLEEKRMWNVSLTSDITFFGWERAIATGNSKLFITEGEFDAAALFQIFKQTNRGTKYADFNPAIVSLPNGVHSAGRDIARLSNLIRKHFKKIVLVFDNDQAGQDGVQEVLKMFPDAESVTLPGKDANECLLEGKIKGAYNATVFNAAAPKNTRFILPADVLEEALKPAEMGLAYPLKGLTDLTRGKRLGETVYWGAGVKMGKSAWLDAMAAQDIKEHGLKILTIKTEEGNARTLKGIVGKIVGKIFHDPKIPMDKKAFMEGYEVVKDNLIMLNLYQQLTWDVLKHDIRAAVNEGVKFIYIDPITTFTNGKDPAEANTLLSGIAQELAQMALDYDVGVHLFCHLRAPESGLTHERGGKVLSTQFAGSRAMMRSCHQMIGIEGNKDPDIPVEQRNLRDIVLLEDRIGGESGRVTAFYDMHTGLFNEVRT